MADDRPRRAAQTFLDRGLPVLHIMFHSSELMPGASPYVRDQHELDRFLGRLRALIETVMAHPGVVPATLREVHARLDGA